MMKPTAKPTETPMALMSKPSRKKMSRMVRLSIPRLRIVDISRFLSMMSREREAMRLRVEISTINESMRMMPKRSER